MSDLDAKLDNLRQEIGRLDDEIIRLISERQNTARAIGQIKIDQNMPIKDYKVEKNVVERNRQRAQKAGLYEDLAEDLTRLLIKYSVIAQDEFQLRRRQQEGGDSRSILVVGGRGNMGLWISEFFDTFGHNVSHYDKSSSGKSRYPLVDDLKKAARESDIVVIATPMSVTASVIDQLSASATNALIFDICSLKSPVIDAIAAARKKGLRMTSVHPMFGPDSRVLAGRNILICNCGDDALAQEAEALFSDTTANVITLPLAQHDELMGYVLGLSHLHNLVFARVLVRSGLPFQKLSEVASTTFTNQLGVTLPVISENQDLYFEIQNQNSFTPQLIDLIKAEIGAYSEAIQSEDLEAFRQLMAESQAYLNPI